jgi:uncharacterized protein YndB with AHSA1/START domain
MGKVEMTRSIAATPQQVFAFFVPQRMPYWYGREMESCLEVQNGAYDFCPGLRVRISGHVGQNRVGHVFEVTAYERPHLLEWRFSDQYGVSGSERWELMPLTVDGTGGTKLRFTSEYRMPGRLGTMVDWLFTRRAVRRRHREYLDRLARLVEPRAAKAPQ